jgi:hypothetical protein
MAQEPSDIFAASLFSDMNCDHEKHFIRKIIATAAEEGCKSSLAWSC